MPETKKCPDCGGTMYWQGDAKHFPRDYWACEGCPRIIRPDKLHPCVEKLEELIRQCLPGWSEGSAEAIQDQFKWEHFRNEAPEILDQHKNRECNSAEEYGKKFAKAKPDPDAKPDEEGEPDDELTDDEISDRELDRQREENSEPDEGVSE